MFVYQTEPVPYYRVKAQKKGSTDSGWCNGANGCAVPGTLAVSAPTSITFTDNAANGPSVTWGGSITSGVTYILEEASDSAFTADVQTIYSGPAKTSVHSNQARRLGGSASFSG